MDRRRLLSLIALSVPLSGCIGGETGDETETKPTASSVETPSPESAPQDCEWPSMCEGSQIVEVVVSSGFSGKVLLHAGCRGEEFTVQPGESVRINREEDGEACQLDLSVDGEQVYSENVPGYKRVTLTVESNGEVETETIVY